MNIDINEIFAEIGKLHMQIAKLQEQLAQLQPTKPTPDKETPKGE